jgi:hypothetical protein
MRRVVGGMDRRTEDKLDEKMTNEEYRGKIIEIFKNIERSDKLRFWYRYISAIEKGEG